MAKKVKTKKVEKQKSLMDTISDKAEAAKKSIKMAVEKSMQRPGEIAKGAGGKDKKKANKKLEEIAKSFSGRK